MTKHRKLIVILVIAAPVLLGIFLTQRQHTSAPTALSLGKGPKKIGLISLNDVIYSSREYIRQLKEFRSDESVAGVIVRVNSPGGTVAPSQEIYDELMRYRDMKKPLIVSMENIAASGGYYIACAAQRIFANPGTLTGSIGVFMSFPHYHALLNKIGVGMTTITAGKYKDMGSPHRDLKREERQLLQNVLDDTHDQFIEAIARGRGMSSDSVRDLATGEIFTGRQAVDNGLVDTLGGYLDAVAYLKALCGLPEKAKVIENSKKGPWWREALTEELEALFPWLYTLRHAGCAFFLTNEFN